MHKTFLTANKDFVNLIKWIIFSRMVFAIVLMISCLVFSSGENLSFLSGPFLTLYKIAAGILVLSMIYLIWLNQFNAKFILAYTQTIIDTFIVTIIIFFTGSYDSIFTFLYLVVIIYTSMLLLQKGSLIIAMISCIQYGILIELEYYQVITPYISHFNLYDTVDETRILYRVIIVFSACFAVSVLSGILARQLKIAKQDLKMTQEHLKRVEKMAAMDEMISGIAHEVNNPLASLSGSIQLLKEEAVPESSEDKLMQIILRETNRLENIVKDIRMFAKPGTGKAHEVKISDSIEEICQLFLNDPQWKNKIKISMNLKKNIWIYIDPLHFHQILWNLLKNAAQSINDHGKIKINLNIHKNRRVYLIVEDDGIGIEPRHSNHIFDPFYTSKPDGTGLGLAIIHRIIDAYDGIIDFESTPGQGTVFTILFNRAMSKNMLTGQSIS